MQTQETSTEVIHDSLDGPVVVETVPASPDHAARGHHKFGMSKLPALGECSGFTSKTGNTKASEEGTLFHEILDEVVNRVKTMPTPRAEPPNEPEAAYRPFRDWDLERLCFVTRVVIQDRGIEITEDDFWLLRYCLQELSVWLPRAVLIHNEINVQILTPSGEELNHGHLDLLLELPGNKGILIDWKFGWIPVAPAPVNYQGKGYGLACFMKFPSLTKIGIKFVQPKLHRTTEAIITRAEIPALYESIKGIIDRAQFGPHHLRPNPYCDFCAAAPSCPALIRNGAAVVQKIDDMPFLDIIATGKAETPEQVVVASFMLSRLEKILEDSPLRAQALELATNAGGKLEVGFGDRIITVEAKERNANRTANSPGMIIQVLEPQVGPEAALDIVMNACEPSVGKLEDNYADVITRLRSEEADKVLTEGMNKINAEHQQAMASLDADLARDIQQIVVGDLPPKEKTAEQKRLKDENKAAVKKLKEDTKAKTDALKAQVREIKITKKDAIASLGSVLEGEGLVTRPDQKIRYAQIRCEKRVSEVPALSESPTVSEVKAIAGTAGE